MQIGGGDSDGLATVVGRLLCSSLGLGLDTEPSFAKVAVAVVVVFAVFVQGFQLLRRAHDDSWVFFAMAMVGGPLLLLPRTWAFVYERYYFLPLLFFLLLLAYVLAELVRRSPLGKVVAGVVLALMAVGNFGEIMDFVENGGRGDFRKALQYIAEQSGGRATTITSDSDLRVPKMLAFYSHYVTPSLRYDYVKANEWQAEARHAGFLAGPCGWLGYSQLHAAEWLIIERPWHGSPPAEKFVFPLEDGDVEYELFAAYEVAAFGGWDWYVYRRVGITP